MQNNPEVEVFFDEIGRLVVRDSESTEIVLSEQAMRMIWEEQERRDAREILPACVELIGEEETEEKTEQLLEYYNIEKDTMIQQIQSTLLRLAILDSELT